ncbi:hypothetical protein GcC1_02204 [Golovinomyces cichoracearum]|uniref:Uncharacterized protein n=1 Tax=Golovinomyces cichoracearum TaxID=62708 RepID=A0A420IUL3_9PEZI|nr:hypothetical protein GcC1_02204 [Golovinomyces cichoracearum]
MTQYFLLFIPTKTSALPSHHSTLPSESHIPILDRSNFKIVNVVSPSNDSLSSVEQNISNGLRLQNHSKLN